jgi:hypothetical protein
MGDSFAVASRNTTPAKSNDCCGKPLCVVSATTQSVAQADGGVDQPTPPQFLGFADSLPEGFPGDGGGDRSFERDLLRKNLPGQSVQPSSASNNHSDLRWIVIWHRAKADPVLASNPASLLGLPAGAGRRDIARNAAKHRLDRFAFLELYGAAD